MKKNIFPKLALTGLKKNKKLYLPYILSCIGMIMMFYIIHSLSYSPLLAKIRGGSSIEIVLSLGKFVVAAFSLLFLFYTNSFLVRTRYKEFGLYSILGMTRKNISKVVIWETIYVALIALAAGLGLGILFSKLAEIGLLNMIDGEIDYHFTVKSEAVLMTMLLYIGIFVILMLRSLIQVRKSKPIELMQSEKAGEKPPKANWLVAAIGLVILLAAYFIAVTIESPLQALTLFFVAVLMVIVATYLLFVAGSVAFCRLLQKKKNYYYKKEHFISVSTMTYRMKRNGAGLASICIIASIVLVLISTTTSLYFGENDVLKSRYARNTEFEVEMNGLSNLNDEMTGKVREGFEKINKEHGFNPLNLETYTFTSISGILDGENVQVQAEADLDGFFEDFSKVRTVYMVTEKEYNRIMHRDVSLKKGEALLYTVRCQYDSSHLNVGGVDFEIKDKLDTFIELSDADQNVTVPLFMMVIHDHDCLKPLEKLTDEYDYPLLSMDYYYGYDYDDPEAEFRFSEDEAKQIYEEQLETMKQHEFLKRKDGSMGYACSCLVAEKEDFLVTFGGLFFIAILLAVMFIFAAAVIIYYKQVSEGYEDQARFLIMQKVGMTKQDIRKSINSQILTVFYAPLVMAGIHLCFAFPMIWRILQLFRLNNLSLVMWVTAGAFVIFGIFYAIIYKLTAKAYYSIVSVDQ